MIVNIKDTRDCMGVIKDILVPQGTASLVRLFLKDSSYFEYDFVKSCIEELEKLPVQLSTGTPINNLQKLAVNVLTDSAYLK